MKKKIYYYTFMSLQYCQIIIVEGWFVLGLDLWCLMPLSTIFLLYWSVLLVEETGLSHNVVSSTPRLRASNSQC